MNENRVAVMSIIVENLESVEKINSYLHEFANFIIGRLGMPHRERNISIISVVIDGPQDKVAALSGKIGNLSGVNVKTLYSKQ